jgi:DNA-binding response OmpR family regulator
VANSTSLTDTLTIPWDHAGPVVERNGRQSVLIVEDDQLTRVSEAEFLRLEGYHVLTAGDAASAFDVVSLERPNAILLDLKLPGARNGLDILRELRARGNVTPIAVVTGHYALDDATEEEIRRLDASIVYKPLWIENVLALVRDLLNTVMGPIEGLHEPAPDRGVG